MRLMRRQDQHGGEFKGHGIEIKRLSGIHLSIAFNIFFELKERSIS